MNKVVEKKVEKLIEEATIRDYNLALIHSQLTPEQLAAMQQLGPRFKLALKSGGIPAGLASGTAGGLAGAIGGGLTAGPIGAGVGALAGGAGMGLAGLTGATLGQMKNLSDLSKMDKKEALKLAKEAEKKLGKDYADQIREFANKNLK